MIGALGLRPLPQRPVEAIRYGRSRRMIRLHALRPERPVRPVVHFAHGADDSGVDPRRQRVPIGIVAVGEEVRHGAAVTCRLQRSPHLVEDARHRLVRDCGLALAQRRDVDAAVLVIGRDVDDALDIAFLLEHLAIVLVGADASGAVLLAVVGLHDLPGDFPAAADTLVARAPLRLLEESTDLIAVAPLAPVDVVLAVAIGIDDGHELNVVALGDAGIDLPLRLGAATDLRQHHHVTRRDVAGASENAARNDGESGSDGQPGQERTAIDVSHGAPRTGRPR